MRLKSIVGKLFCRRWKHVVAAAVATVFLLPMPVLALTFLGSWTFRQTQFNAPPITPTFGDDSTGGFLQLNAGFAPATFDFPFGVSTLTAIRDFRVTNSNEIFNVTQGFNSLLQGANANVTVQVTNLNGSPNPPTVFSFARNERAGNRFSRLTGTPNSNTTLLNGGDYRLKIQVRYRKSRVGIWDTTDLQEASPHLFNFTGI
jgi:hypothetical protein